jgi:hypothetical protein
MIKVAKENQTLQYASAYFVRLNSLRPILMEAAVTKWPETKISEEIVSVKEQVWEI